MKGLEYADIEGFDVPDDEDYRAKVHHSLENRTTFLREQKGLNRLPDEAIAMLLDLEK